MKIIENFVKGLRMLGVIVIRLGNSNIDVSVPQWSRAQNTNAQILGVLPTGFELENRDDYLPNSHFLR